MTITRDLAAVVDLACLTVDRTRAEQAALVRIARKVDTQINRQTSFNPHLPIDRDRTNPPPCTYSATHGKTRVCRGDGTAWEPVGGWSRRLEHAKASA